MHVIRSVMTCMLWEGNFYERGEAIAAASVIKEQANRQAADEDCTFLFVQVGYDAQATKYLKMLDDDLRGAKFDIVDAKTIDEAEKFATTADLVLAAIAD